MDDNEIDTRTDPNPSPVTFEIAVGKVISIGNGALMFHPRIRSLDQFVTVFLKRILTKIVLKCLKQPLRLRKLFFRLLKIFGQKIEFERKTSQLVREMLVVTNV